jgi:endonuclease YncB( thermonuclease family)
MKIRWLRDSILALCFLLLTFLIGEKVKDDASRTFTGSYRVVDGDSLALGKTRFRLLGIDAPELSQVCQREAKPWRCGDAARLALSDLVSAGAFDCKGGRTDKYRRLLVTCFSKGIDINRQMVLRGMAVSFGGYDAEESSAKGRHIGIWASQFIRPVEWRRSQKAGMEEAPHMPSWLDKLFGNPGT